MKIVAGGRGGVVIFRMRVMMMRRRRNESGGINHNTESFDPVGSSSSLFAN